MDSPVKPEKKILPDLRFDEPSSLPRPDHAGRVHFEGAEIAYASFGSGPALIFLHGALGNADDWGNQLPVFVELGRRVILIDSRGRGRSTRGGPPLSYELMAQEVIAVMDALNIERADIVGWSDGAIISLILAMHAPQRIGRVVAYAGNMDQQGVRSQIVETEAMEQAFARSQSDYARLSETPQDFQLVLDQMTALMQSEPNFSAEDLSAISRPVTIVHGELDEFIRQEHAAYLAETIPDARLVVIPGASHFAPWQKPAAFNDILEASLQAG